jgi:hypothetical protein
VQGKVFSFCDMRTKKMVRLVSHSCALDIDVFTGLSLLIDDQTPESLDFAKSVKINKLSIRNLRIFHSKSSGQNGSWERSFDHCWIYNPHEFKTVHHVSLLGLVTWKWSVYVLKFPCPPLHLN